jgi:hypothetical protein
MRKPGLNKQYNTSVTFEPVLIAPCGLNCGSCIAFMRPENRCPGCWHEDKLKNKSCVRCIIKNCDLLEKTDSKFCYECSKYPCTRLKQLDKRYRTKYRTSLFDNLMMIKQNGMGYFLAFETERRKCPGCGSTLSIHREHCLVCSQTHQGTIG